MSDGTDTTNIEYFMELLHSTAEYGEFMVV